MLLVVGCSIRPAASCDAATGLGPAFAGFVQCFRAVEMTNTPGLDARHSDFDSVGSDRKTATRSSPPRPTSQNHCDKHLDARHSEFDSVGSDRKKATRSSPHRLSRQNNCDKLLASFSGMLALAVGVSDKALLA